MLQRQTLADALAAYMRQLGMKRRVKPVGTLADYVKEKYGGREPEPSDAVPIDPNGDHGPTDAEATDET